MNYLFNNIKILKILKFLILDYCLNKRVNILLFNLFYFFNIIFIKYSFIFKYNIFILFNYFKLVYINKYYGSLIDIYLLSLSNKTNKVLRGELNKISSFLYNKKYKHQKILSVFLNKFMRAGKSFIVEKVFFSLLETKKSVYFFFFLFEALEVLRPSLSVKLFTFKPKGKKKSVKKGKRVKKRVKVIPEKVNYNKSCKISFKWLTTSIIENTEGYNLSDKKNSIIKELYSIYFFNKGDSVKKKKNLYKLAAKNRSSMHFRWKKSF